MAGKIRPIKWWLRRVELPDPKAYQAMLEREGLG